MTHDIVVPHDGSPAGDRAIPVAVAFARVMDAPVRLVRVCLVSAYADPPMAGAPIVELLPAPYFGDSPQDVAVRETARCEEAARVLGERASRVGAQYGVRAGADVEVALDVARGLLACVARLDPPLVVMATHGRTGVARALLGSVADAVSRESHVPVVLVPERDAVASGADYALRRVLVAVDGSEDGAPFLDRVAALVRGGAVELLLFSVVPSALVSGIPVPAAMRGDADNAATIRERTASLERLAAGVRETGLRVETRVEQAADVGGALRALAAAERVDLIAMATHARRGLRRLARGSVADRVLRGTAVPVLLLHPAGWRTPAGLPATSV